MRTIKSQDGKMIVNAKKLLSFSVRKIGSDKEYSVIADSWAYDESWITLGLYSTEKRALRGLDMLNGWLTEYPTPDLDCPSSLNFEKHRIWWKSFQLPQDSEELEA